MVRCANDVVCEIIITHNATLNVTMRQFAVP